MKSFLLILIIFSSLLAKQSILTKVVDGDTLYFANGEKCRIEYIDTPESKMNKKLYRDIKQCNISATQMKRAGLQATKHAKTLLSKGNRYNYNISGKDRYGRSICVVEVDRNLTFNEKMVIDGYAAIYRQYMDRQSLKKFTSLMSDAKQSNKGLWHTDREAIECLDEARK